MSKIAYDEVNTVGLVHCKIIHSHCFDLVSSLLLTQLCTSSQPCSSCYTTLHMHVNSSLTGLDLSLAFETKDVKERVEPMA
jgi:hypothetical protein